MNTTLKPIFLMTLASALALLVGCSKPSESTGAPAPSTSIGSEIDDSVITASVKTALLGDPDIRSFDLKVETHKGLVQLSGFVDNAAQVERAITVARGVSGVKDVQNKVSFKSTETTVGNKVDDSVVTTRVKAALLADASVQSLDIAVITRKGEVQLSGFVDNQGQATRAIEIARAIPGVSQVINDMSVKK